MNRRAFLAAIPILAAGCSTIRRIRGGLILSVNGIDEKLVRRLAEETARHAGRDWPDFRLTVNAIRTTSTAWSPTYARPVATFDNGEFRGACGVTTGSRKSGLVRLAVMPNGYIPDRYIVHELAHALALATTGDTPLPAEWAGWVLGLHP